MTRTTVRSYGIGPPEKAFVFFFYATLTFQFNRSCIFKRRRYTPRGVYACPHSKIHIQELGNSSRTTECSAARSCREQSRASHSVVCTCHRVHDFIFGYARTRVRARPRAPRKE